MALGRSQMLMGSSTCHRPWDPLPDPAERTSGGFSMSSCDRGQNDVVKCLSTASPKTLRGLTVKPIPAWQTEDLGAQTFSRYSKDQTVRLTALLHINRTPFPSGISGPDVRTLHWRVHFGRAQALQKRIRWATGSTDQWHRNRQQRRWHLRRCRN